MQMPLFLASLTFVLGQESDVVRVLSTKQSSLSQLRACLVPSAPHSPGPNGEGLVTKSDLIPQLATDIAVNQQPA